MEFRLVDNQWNRELEDAVAQGQSDVAIVCPFIKERIANRLLKQGKPKRLRVLTRFNLQDFFDGVSDTSALKVLLNAGAQIRGIKNLHSKLYLFGNARALVTSANLTEAALLRNHEFGFVADDDSILGECNKYFEGLWDRAGLDLTLEKLSNWEEKILVRKIAGGPPTLVNGLGDEGTNLGIPPEPSGASIRVSGIVDDPDQYFVKFSGSTNTRSDRNDTTLSELKRSGSHWACSYSKNKRPRAVRSGAIMFISRLVRDPDDIIIYGRAKAMRYVDGRDDARPEEISDRGWKANWPHYVRVHSPQFIDGVLNNGISLHRLMDELGPHSFASTERNLAAGSGNTDPRRAYRRQASVALSPTGFQWLNQQFERQLQFHGAIPPSRMQELDWPSLPELSISAVNA